MGGEIINADAFQVYQGLDIGTGKVTAALRNEIPHHLLDIVPPHAQFTAGEFGKRARSIAGEISRRGRTPILVGGTGFYIRSFLKGLADIPPVPAHLRGAITALGEKNGWNRLYRWLEVLDSPYAASISPSDRQRIERALEVTLHTGHPLSSYFREESTSADQIPSIKIGITMERSLLAERIRQRVRSMVRSGWLDEVRTLLIKGCTGEEPAFKAIGYREIFEVLQGRQDLEGAIETIASITIKYAKRQMTWFRKESHVTWFDGRDIEVAKVQILEYYKGRTRSTRALK